MAAHIRDFLQRHIVIAHCVELAILLLLLAAIVFLDDLTAFLG